MPVLVAGTCTTSLFFACVLTSAAEGKFGLVDSIVVRSASEAAYARTDVTLVDIRLHARRRQHLCLLCEGVSLSFVARLRFIGEKRPRLVDIMLWPSGQVVVTGDGNRTFDL